MHINPDLFFCFAASTGQLYMEDVPTMILCKPKLLPLKSVTLEKLEKMQMEAQEAIKQQELAVKEQVQQMPSWGLETKEEEKKTFEEHKSYDSLLKSFF